MGLLELATATMRGAEQRVEIAAHNAVNAGTPGYKSKVAFSELETASAMAGAVQGAPTTKVEQSALQGALLNTGENLDLAINGPGNFLVRDGDTYDLVRTGNFGINGEGAMIDSQGRVLQLETGGDAIVNSYAIEVLENGTMLSGDVPIGKIALFDIPQNGDRMHLSADAAAQLEAAQTSEIHQAMLEGSNVTLSDEMVELMRAQRQVETGAQLIRAYDQVLSRAVSTFDRSAS